MACSTTVLTAVSSVPSQFLLTATPISTTHSRASGPWASRNAGGKLQLSHGMLRYCGIANCCSAHKNVAGAGAGSGAATDSCADAATVRNATACAGRARPAHRPAPQARASRRAGSNVNVISPTPQAASHQHAARCQRRR
jgi:hypothetical protein